MSMFMINNSEHLRGREIILFPSPCDNKNGNKKLAKH